MAARKSGKLPLISVIDAETDPFLHGRRPYPFVFQYRNAFERHTFWGRGRTREEMARDVCRQLVQFFRSRDVPEICYAHNGGKFDFLFFIEEIEGKIKIIGRRLALGHVGKVELRDSYLIIPEPLRKAGSKLEIDMSKFEWEVRQDNRAEILEYLDQDCDTLLELVTEYLEEFGDKLTIGSTAMGMLRDLHDYEQLSLREDERWRKFFFGGRCQVFEPGIHTGNFKLYDRNSMYAAEMKYTNHPIGGTFHETRTITDSTDFAIIEATNIGIGALPVRDRGALSFTVESGTFYATGHEIRAGLNTGTLSVKRVIAAWECNAHGTFAEFVDYVTDRKIESEYARDRAREAGDEIGYQKNQIRRDNFKRVGNSGYGKFAQNASEYHDYCMTGAGDDLPLPQPKPGCANPDECRECGKCWTIAEQNQAIVIWKRPAIHKTFYNVAIGASITGASRANWLRTACRATRLMYGDTDSLLCEGLGQEVPLHPTELGAWKLEPFGPKKLTTLDRVSLAGKKLYAFWIGNECVKTASKGVRMTGEQIDRIAQGEVISFKIDAPNFKLNGECDFIERRIKRTA